MITKIKLYLAFLLFYAKRIRMRGLCDSLVLMYHVFFLVFFNNVDKHHCVKHRLNLKFLQKHIDLQSQDAPPNLCLFVEILIEYGCCGGKEKKICRIL